METTIKITLIVTVLFAFVLAQDDFILLQKDLSPVQGMIDDAVATKPTGKDASSIVQYTFSPVIYVSALGQDLKIRLINEEEQIFKETLPGFFKGKYKAKDYNHVFIQKIRGYTIIHFINDVLYKSYVQEITNNKYYIMSQLTVTRLKDKTIYGFVADFQRSE